MKIDEDFLGVHLTEKQSAVARALSAGGQIEKIKEPERKSHRYYIGNPCSKIEVDIANVTIRALQKKGVLDEDLRFTQVTFSDHK